MNAWSRPIADPRRGRRERLLQRHLEAAERILVELDALDGDADLEPSLAGFGGFPGSGDDREADHYTGLNAGVSDDEPWLGAQGGTATSKGSQLHWASGPSRDLEDEHDGREPVSEDEGAQCEDEGSYRDGDYEPDGDGEGSPNLVWDIGGRRMWDVHGAERSPVDPGDDPHEIAAPRCEAGLS